MKNIVFVVPTYNRSTIIKKTAYVNYQIAKRYGASFIVIDNNSTDDTYTSLLNLKEEISLVKNDQNIGLKGSFSRVIKEYCNDGDLVIVLSDEDVIYEPGLNALCELWKTMSYVEPKIFVFNHLNKIGKDFYSRRYNKKIESWSDVEIFSFGLISGFGFWFDSEIINKLDWNSVENTKNNYPHWSFLFDGTCEVVALGMPISALYKESRVSYLDLEWKSKKGHFSSESVKDYMSYHSSKYKAYSGYAFRVKYRIVAAIFRGDGGKLTEYILFLVLLMIAPRDALTYIIRKYH